ncbi:Lrp/AsnC family transcriptional regulator [Dasania sp. GY-MA-18]|uniref:Lrp/AsnC family transcriptional regulator n=1 Tax=Dasania phycosphaerae TaxID=2950436 RepID=A0A9J6RPB8_9GAMM|nr:MULTISPECIES: Lrp/AsnC family transcriptional regulator [Dasania]MCR8923533.1 Lrp/AsnC family transcriptional regulator [Dasania sp. GY-MA-18]MCZ0865967.1 Lrp/AsnC family transcriptional regulator [Dasania phycosphaerae]MCZ0869691.1 Lrp/AsnC family transcriptional regulator [Dasania phycosphaerae]
MKLDKINLRILNTLQKDATISNQRLADEIGLSESACLSRVRKLKQENYLQPHAANINLKKIPHAHFIVSIALKSQEPKLARHFRSVIDAIPQITACYMVSGQFDYIVHFICRDAAEFNELSEDLVQQEIGIEKMNSQLIIGDIKPFSGYPLDLLLGAE